MRQAFLLFVPILGIAGLVWYVSAPEYNGGGGQGIGIELNQGLPAEHQEMLGQLPKGQDGFLAEAPDDGLHRLSKYGLVEEGPREWIVPVTPYVQPGLRRSWDEAPPLDIKAYTGPKDVYATHAFNEKVSNTIVSDRNVPDTRDSSCPRLKYNVNDLPTTSVIICFHNEARSTLLRTIRSVIRRTPPNLLAEVILVDDASDWPIPDDILAMAKVHALRLDSREGLIRARTIGAQAAKGEVLTYLDSHCEVNEAWIQPLLKRIKTDYKIVVTPIIDLIDEDTFHYDASPVVRGGFNWGLTFRWKPVSKRDKRPTNAHPISSPTMAGGLFSIHRKWFAELGTYDLGMDIWGAENLEISFRIWQCGGRLEIMPCSRVGHVFRKRHPYTFPGGGIGSIFLKNTLRAARVWMDEYVDHFYHSRGGSPQDMDVGDLTERLQVKKQLQCKSFQWYLEEVYPELRVPDDEPIAWGEIREKGGTMCFDTLGKDSGNPVGMYSCHGQGGNQAFTLTRGKELKTDGDLCIDAKTGRSKTAMLRACAEDATINSQLWTLNAEGQLHNALTGLCLDRAGHANSENMEISTCDSKASGQHWTFGNYKEKKEDSKDGKKDEKK